MCVCVCVCVCVCACEITFFYCDVKIRYRCGIPSRYIVGSPNILQRMTLDHAYFPLQCRRLSAKRCRTGHLTCDLAGLYSRFSLQN